MIGKNIVVLTGGTGTVKLINGLYEINPDNLTIITNTADDFSFYGLYVSPDTDAVLYSLSDLLDKEKMWGLKDDKFTVKNIIEQLDKEGEYPIASWFNLGDKDLAYCLYRSHLLQKGKTLSEAVGIVAKQLGIKSKIFPMADTPVGTYFTTNKGEYHLEEYFIRLRAKPDITKIEIKGADNAEVSDRLINEIIQAKLIIIGPSNPISSIGPILKINEIKKAIKNNPCAKLVISPIIGSRPVSGPAHKYMKNEGFEVSPIGVYNFYKDTGTIFMFDKSDKELYSKQLENLSKNRNQTIIYNDIIIPTRKEQIKLAESILELK